MTAASNAARRGALIVSDPQRKTLVVTGKDRVDWLNGLLSCDVREVAPDKGVHGLLLSKKGKIVTDVYIAASSDALYLGVSSDKVTEIRELLDKMLVMEDAEMEDRSAELAWATLHGPRANEVAARASGTAWGGIDFTGLGGAVLVVPREESTAIIGSLASEDVVVGSPEDWLSLRVERGFPEFGVDYGHEDNPHEASLDQRAVSWTKGCYLGQEVVCMQGMRGRVKRRVVALVVESGEPPAPGTPVLDADGSPAGNVTSSARSEVVGTAVALARVSGDPKSPLRVGPSSARIVERPDAA